MSGISFKITAPGRPAAASANAPPSRPSSRPTSRHHSQRDRAAPSDDDSEDDDDAFRRAGGRDSKRRKVDEEEVIEFGRDGATSKHAKPKPAAPLVIPALPNKDWRKAAEELRAGRNPGRKRDMYLPERGGGMRMREGADASNGTPAPIKDADVDAINTEEVVGGLEKRDKKVKTEPDENGTATPDSKPLVESPPPPAPRVQSTAEETEEQKAMRELLGEAGAVAKTEEAELEAIYSAADARNGPIEEADAFKRDVNSRPDEASLDDYARVPVGAFGLAMLRGMGWQPGQAASRSGRGAIEAHVPSSRPSLLGIGAKPMAEAMGDGKKGAKGKNGSSATAGKSRREEMKFMPLIKQAREGSASGRNTPLPITDGSGSSSRRPSRSPPPPSSSRRDRDRSPRRERDRDDRRSSKYDRDDRDDRRSSRRDDDRKSSRHEDDRRSSRYDEDRRGSSRRDDGDRRRDSDRDSQRHRDDRGSSRDDRRRDDRDRDRRETSARR